jgi:hypothetical protein
MGLHHLGLLKVGSWLFGLLVGAVVFAMDPTTKAFLFGLCIASIPPTITGLFTLRKLNRIDVNVDGRLGKLLNEKDAADAKLADKSAQLAHAQGRREGVESKEPKE